MEDHIEVIMNCAKKFPELRFGQFIKNAMVEDYTDSRLFYINDRDLAELCKKYCKNMGR